ncbi:MAG: tetratricopeptide repeat protein, partial [Pleurocapsa sp.]
MLFLFIILFLGLCYFLFIQYQRYCKANRLYHQAKELEKKDRVDPNNSDKLKEALAVYKQCDRLVKNSTYTKAINRCQKKIDDRLRFQSLINAGRNRAMENYFKEALHNFLKAKKLFSTSEIKQEIDQCNQSIKEENQYEQVLEKSNQIARAGKFQAAIDLLRPAVDNFTRQDGKKLLNKLKLAIKTKSLYQSGLIAEHQGEFDSAIALYKQALELIPEYIDCKLRLAIIATKNKPQRAIDYVKGIDNEQGIYIRGFAYTQLENWQQAEREWSALNCSNTEIQRYNIINIVERDRLKIVYKIEQLVDKKQIEIAKSISIDFIEKYEDHSIVKNNLENYIDPVLENRVWQNKNWTEVVSKTKQSWLEKQDIKSLHNWAIATYYQGQG